MGWILFLLPLVLFLLCAFNFPSYVIRAISAAFKGDANAEQENREMACICMGCGSFLWLLIICLIFVMMMQ